MVENIIFGEKVAVSAKNHGKKTVLMSITRVQTAINPTS